MMNAGPKINIECRVCNSVNDNNIYSFKEVLFGVDQSFDYFECAECGCMQIKEVPVNIADFYPEEYGAYNKHKSVGKAKGLLKYLRLKKSQHCLGTNKNLIGWIMQKLFTGGFVEKLKPAGIDFEDTILDVGTGTGGRILDLKERGFKNLYGTDIFIPHDISYDNGIKIFKTELKDIKENYDFIMLNHSFEHMPDPLDTFKELYRILKKGKYLLIRIPVIDSYSWKHYKENWIALDPPRHFFIHSKKSIEILARQTNFVLKQTIDDSTEYQFVGSEQILQGIPAYSEKSYFVNPEGSIFSSAQIKKFKKKAKQLNKIGEGDYTCFYLYKE